MLNEIKTLLSEGKRNVQGKNVDFHRICKIARGAYHYTSLSFHKEYQNSHSDYFTFYHSLAQFIFDLREMASQIKFIDIPCIFFLYERTLFPAECVMKLKHFCQIAILTTTA